MAETSGIEVIHTPYQAPLANSICERFVGSLRRECLDHVLVLGNRQLMRVLNEFAEYFNPIRPHQGIGQQTPKSRLAPVPTTGTRTIIPFATSSAAPTQRSTGNLVAVPVLNGLHLSYAWAT